MNPFVPGSFPALPELQCRQRCRFDPDNHQAATTALVQLLSLVTSLQKGGCVLSVQPVDRDIVGTVDSKFIVAN
jgi:hypothetical protein